MSKFGELPSNNLGVFAVKRAIFAAIRPQFDDDLHSSRCLSKDHNFDFSRVIGSHFCTYRSNLVRFDSVTPEFNTLEGL